MDAVTIKLRAIYENAGSLLLGAALAYAFGFIWGLEVNLLFVLAVSFLTMAVSMLMNARQYNLLLGIVFILAAVFLLISFSLLKVDVWEKIQDFFRWFGGYFFGKGELNTRYAYFFLGIMAFVLSLLIRRLDRFLPARVILSAVLLVSGLAFCLSGIALPKFSVCIGVFYFLNTLIELVNLTLGRRLHLKDSRTTAVYLMPVCLFVGILVVLLPSDAEPIRWTHVKRAAASVSESAQLLIAEIRLKLEETDGAFNLNFNGYSEAEKDLGGNIYASNNTILRFSTSYQTRSDLYLTGAVRNVYTGRRWKFDASQAGHSYDEYEMDLLELLGAFQRAGISPEEMSAFLDTRAIDIHYADVKTRSLFYPLKTYRIIPDDSSREADLSGAGMTFKRIKGRDTSYRLEFWEVNYASTDFQAILREAEGYRITADPPDTEKLVPYMKKYVGILRDFEIDYSQEKLQNALAARAQSIRQEYTALPGALPDRVRRLALDLTEPYSNNYDKLRAIEAFLNTYTYTTVPGSIPNGEDPVDYFLFESKEGYCTYFASAMAVLGRCIGIPTRYVEGAVADYTQKVESMTYNVSGNDSHAWPEAYFEGVGWVPFEPTSGYMEGRYAEWPVLQPGGAVGVPEPDFEPPSMPDFSEYEIPEPTDLPVVQNDYSSLIAVLVSVGLGIVFVCLLILAYFYLARLRYQRRYDKSTTQEKMHSLFDEILFYFKWLRLRLEPWDTLLTFSQRENGHYVFEEVSFLSVAELFMAVRYAHQELSLQELEPAQVYRNGLQEEVRKSLGKWKMFWLVLSYYSGYEAKAPRNHETEKAAV